MTYEAVGEPIKVRKLKPLVIKGKKAPIGAYKVLGLQEEEEEEKEGTLEKISPDKSGS